MLVLTDLTQLDVAMRKALKVRPRLRVIEFGHYEVQGSSGNWYKVNCKKSGTGQKLVFCSCEDEGKRRVGYTCYHMATAVGAHILLALAKEALAGTYNITYDNEMSGAPDKHGEPINGREAD